MVLKRLKNNVSTTVTVIRRIGKTGHIKHVFSQLPGNTIKVYIDLLPTEKVSDFNSTLLKAIACAVDENNTTEKFLDLYKAITSGY